MSGVNHRLDGASSTRSRLALLEDGAVKMLHEELAQVVLVGRDLAEVLTEITGIARRGLPGADATSITLIRGEHPFTVAHDGQMALDADELQYERGYGPCVDAGRAGQIFLVEDMRTERRWPDYAPTVPVLDEVA